MTVPPLVPAPTINLTQLTQASTYNLEIVSEHPADRESRLERENSSHQSVIVTGYVKLGLTVALLLAIGGAALHKGIFDPKATPEERKWGTTVLTSLVTGGLGFLAGEKIGKGAKD